MKKIVALALMAVMLFALVPTALAAPALNIYFGFDANGDTFVDTWVQETVTDTTFKFKYDANSSTSLPLAKQQGRYDPKPVPYVPIRIDLPAGYNYSTAKVYINDTLASVSVDTNGVSYITAAVIDPASKGAASYPFKLNVVGNNYNDTWNFQFIYSPATSEYDMTVSAEGNGIELWNNNNMVTNKQTTEYMYDAYVYNNKLYIDYYGVYYPADLSARGDVLYFDVNFSFYTTAGVPLYDKEGRQYLTVTKSWFNTVAEVVLEAKNRVLVIYSDKDTQSITFWVDNGKAFYKRTLPVVYRAVEGQNDPKGIYFGNDITTVKEGTTFKPSVYTVQETSLKYFIVLFDQYGNVYDGNYISAQDSNKRTTSAGSKVDGNKIVAGDPGVIWARAYMVYTDASKTPAATPRVYWDDIKITVTGGATNAGNYYVTARSLNVRKGPGTNYAKVSPYNVYRNDVLNVVSISGGWAKVDMNGSTVYVSASYIAKK